MTIPKTGSSHPDEIDCYPVKRRGRPRKLEPNWAGIDWLEKESEDDCQIYSQDEVGEGLIYTKAYGKLDREYSRPMFQIIAPTASPYFQGRTVTPCQCDRFDQSWACEDHPQIPWNAETRRWERPGNVPVTAYAAPVGTPEPSIADTLVRAYQRLIEESYSRRDSDRMAFNRITEAPESRRARETRCTCSMCRPGGQSYEENALATSASLREAVMAEARRQARIEGGWPVRGMVLGRPAVIHENGRLTFTDRRGGSTNADRIRWVPDRGVVRSLGEMVAGGRVPDALMPDAADRLARLPDGSITVRLDNTNATYSVEVTGDTVQAPSSTFRIEVERDGTENT